MNIGIDALPLMGRGGISRHLRELLPALLTEGPGHRYHLFARLFRREARRRHREVVREFGGPQIVWRRVLVPDSVLELAWTRHGLALPGTRQCLGSLDVLLATTGLVPVGAPCPIVGVVHDLVPLRFPQWLAADLPMIQARLKRLIERSRLLIAVSESTRRDLVELGGVPPERVRVVHHGIHSRFTAPAPERVHDVLAARGIRRPFFLYVGGLGPVKNVGALLEALARLRTTTGVEQKLVIAGDLGWAGSLRQDVQRLGVTQAVSFLGFVGDDELPALYAGATAVILPSWHESFGFPALEAMACGAPVLAASVGALPELLGAAAVFFAPGAPGELAGAMARVAADPELGSKLRTLGRARAARFTWGRAAAETLEVLRDAVEQQSLGTPIPWPAGRRA